MSKIEILHGYPLIETDDHFFDAIDYGVTQPATATKFARIDEGGAKIVFRGDFDVDLNGKVTGGIVTGFDVYVGDLKIMHATGYELNAGTLYERLENVNLYYELLVDSLTGDTKIVGSKDDDYFWGEEGAKLFGMDGDDWVFGAEGSQVIKGGRGNDIVAGDGGLDELTGGKGKDVFGVYQEDGLYFTKITDFSPKNDTIGLDYDSDGFYDVFDQGFLTGKEFKVGSQADTPYQHILYNKATGGLFFDVDGNGATARVKIAELDKNLALKANDFFVTDML